MVFRILVVDDDIHISDLLTEVLIREEYTVDKAFSGTEVLLVLSGNKPDLILLDLMLPGLCGQKLLSKIITISGNDKEMKKLADNINKQLKILRKEYRRYKHGDFELKTAITNISLDIRTPLTAICGYLDLLQDNADTAKTKEYISIMKERAELMQQLTEELFRYSVILSDDTEPETEQILINQVLEDSIMGYYAVLTKNGISPEIHITEKQIIANLNKEHLTRIIYNLLNNAVKYSDGDLQITLTDSGEMIFANTAKDLSSVQVDRLFDRFYTVHCVFSV